MTRKEGLEYRKLTNRIYHSKGRIEEHTINTDTIEVKIINEYDFNVLKKHSRHFEKSYYLGNKNIYCMNYINDENMLERVYVKKETREMIISRLSNDIIKNDIIENRDIEKLERFKNNIMDMVGIEKIYIVKYHGYYKAYIDPKGLSSIIETLEYSI